MPDESPTRPSIDAPAKPGRIARLPELLINQIAAGEVIERPASVLKELVENALDAGATRIDVLLEQGGMDLVRVTDNGRGIPPGDLPLALSPHATSKITQACDLDRIATMGFRGEALASIASIARVEIRSRVAGQPEAWVIGVHGGRATEPAPASGPVGTRVAVRTLFYNTPARRKFLRTPQTEKTRCVQWLKDLALARPGVAMTLIADGRTVLDLPADQGPRSRTLAILGPELADQLVEAQLDDGAQARGIAIWGLVGLPTIARATTKAQHIFINGRVIRDKTIQHALKEAYRGLIEPGRHPTAVLMIELDPSAVDVNVHPAKLEVRFRDQSMVHGAVLRAVRDALGRADLTPTVPSRALAGQQPVGSGLEILPAGAHKGKSPGAMVDPTGFVQSLRAGEPTAHREPLDYDALARAMQRDPPGGQRHELTSADPREADLLDAPPAGGVLQVHQSFLVTQDALGLVIVDQHALHERVMFEQLLERVTRGPLESQQLLTPIVVQASPQVVEDLAPLFERIGIETRALGPTSVGVGAFPTLLFERGVDPLAFMQDLIEWASRSDFAPGSEEALHEVLDMMACKAAIKAGDRLSLQEREALLAQRERIERSSNCPHGRPTTIRLTIAQLERLFGRS